MASQVHRIRFYKPKPEPISCVSFNKTKKLLALARVDASIELWDLKFTPYLVKFIPGVENGSIEALCWVENRLLSTGLVGSLVEWDLEKLVVKNSVLLTGYAAWCLDLNAANTMVAVGTEQGYINLFNVEHGDIVYAKLFDKQEGRIMCCKFDKTGNFLITGSLNSIRVWNTETGHAITKISVSGSQRTNDVIIWSLAVLSENIIASGDSLGRLTFWDSALGDQIESYQTHKADILAIAVSENEEQIYCSGVDPMIMSYQKVEKNCGGEALQWMKNVQRNIHMHDVRALVMNEDTLISVGNDGYLSLSRFPPKWVKRVPPMIPGPRSSLALQKKLLLLRYSKHLEVWRLGSPAVDQQGQLVFSHNNKQETVVTNGETKLEVDSTEAINKAIQLENSNRRTLRIGQNPVKLVAIHAKKKKTIRCCEISPSGEIIVYGTDSDIRMLKLESDDDESSTSLTKLVITGVTLPCNRIVFTEDSRSMVMHGEGALQVLQVDPDAGATVIQTIMTNKHLKSGSILHLLISKKTPSKRVYLVAADTEGAIAMWSHTGQKWEHYATLPTYNCVPSAIAFDTDKESLVITYVDQKLLEYKLAEKKFEEWPRYGLPATWYERESAIQSITAHPVRNALVFQDETSLWVMDRPSKDAETCHLAGPEAKKDRKEKKVQKAALKVIPIKYLAGFHWVADSEAVTIEVLPESIVAQLPATAVKTRNFNVG
ncbi:U3 small nucleolar RNA-associated protein 4 homolog [Cydia pomonella]|uniref:U3 small nucleolar RNA-associated protein 4 homolog n=1 Tax=Cydia pomonella TaxID=82600 RepID=UPI002ADDDA9E|nr:U3 small nucleolar RNA-associated protein 4 homolog [Cydia pomonella]